jgi:succinate dehydrogenase flavin-adding protein (antitoxin of CptAB toxin-antitoxin module)
MILEGFVMKMLDDDDADRRNQFQKLLSQDDIDCMERILKKSRMNADTRGDLNTALTKQEKTWRANFAWQAFLWGFAKKPLNE